MRTKFNTTSTSFDMGLAQGIGGSGQAQKSGSQPASGDSYSKSTEKVILLGPEPAKGPTREAKRTVMSVLAAQVQASMKATPGAAEDTGQPGWAVFGRQPDQYSSWSNYAVEYGVVPDQETAVKLRDKAIAIATTDLEVPGLTTAEIKETAAMNLGIAPVNVLTNTAGAKYFQEAAELREALKDPKRKDAAAAKPQFAVIHAAFGSGAYGFSGPEASFISKAPQTLADAQALLVERENALGYQSSYRIVPASLMEPAISDYHGMYLAGTNHPANELQRFMQAGGDLDKLTVERRSWNTVVVHDWLITEPKAEGQK
ncbi:MAG: hypothetical protein U1E65_21585 [Myxococcota bacterium]